MLKEKIWLIFAWKTRNWDVCVATQWESVSLSIHRRVIVACQWMNEWALNKVAVVASHCPYTKWPRRAHATDWFVFSELHAQVKQSVNSGSPCSIKQRAEAFFILIDPSKRLSQLFMRQHLSTVMDRSSSSHHLSRTLCHLDLMVETHGCTNGYDSSNVF